ncbi:replication initiation protein [Acinetobacter beijerinckii]|nr:replication initiation protein [Acinetobacter beijerinckii]
MFGMANNSLALASNDSLTIVLKRFYNNLPDKPYHSNGFDVEGLKINRKIEAVKKKYIQFNHPNWKKYILIDIDRPGAVTDWLYESPHLPAPNLIIENRKNGHAHFVYELIDAVSFTERSSLKAQNYYNAVEKALTRELGGDERYNGVVGKNPCSEEWRTSTYRTEAYHLKDLASKLELTTGLTPFEVPQKAQNDESAINGRNDEIFHSVRHLAYKDIRDFKNNAGLLFNHWFDHVLKLVQEKNSYYINPMDYKECTHIAKSISKYCWRNHAECHRQFVERQRIKGSKGGTNRSAKYEEARRMTKLLFRQGVSLKQIAEKVNISYRSVVRYTKGLLRIKLLSFNDINNLRKSALADKKARSGAKCIKSEQSEGINNVLSSCDTSPNQVLAARHTNPAHFGVFFKTFLSLTFKNLKFEWLNEKTILNYYSKIP